MFCNTSWAKRRTRNRKVDRVLRASLRTRLDRRVYSEIEKEPENPIKRQPSMGINRRWCIALLLEVMCVSALCCFLLPCLPLCAYSFLSALISLVPHFFLSFCVSFLVSCFPFSLMSKVVPEGFRKFLLDGGVFYFNLLTMCLRPPMEQIKATPISYCWNSAFQRKPTKRRKHKE